MSKNKTSKGTKKKGTKYDKVTVTGVESLPPSKGLPTNPNIPTHHADMVNMQISDEGLALMRFFSRTPGLNVEECRISFNHILAKKIVDLICSVLNYDPHNSSQKK